ncbi:hypothetical protein WMW72_00680 [Paenibacillus filicis]|uniref:YhfC family intramembrane metalloprotease n=1 Tax=Paenibacillus filicis TaxID=669464 RepID=A0ABU9DC65_9BACL
MTIIEYILYYPVLWSGLFSFGLALSRARVSAYKKQLLLSVMLLSIVSVMGQYFELVYLFGIVLPISASLCFWLIFKFRPFHAILIGQSVYASGGFSEILYNSVAAGFRLEQMLYYLQNDIAMVGILIGLQHMGLYALLHRLRLGFTFISPSLANHKTRYPRTWFVLALGISFLLAMINISVYFTSKLLIIILIVHTVCWLIILFLSYRKELED